MENDTGDFYRLNTTDDYHKEDLQALGWELTVCNSLYPDNSPVRKLLKINAPYGQLLYDFLSEHIPLDTIVRVLEVGGGYGYLILDFISRNPSIRPSMLDISPTLLANQRQALSGREVEYLCSDALDIAMDFLRAFELVIFNENLGDFPTLIGGNDCIFDKCHANGPDSVLVRLHHFFETYDLQKPHFPSNINIGAFEMVEKVCAAGVPYVFIGEHSCESQVPQQLKSFFDIAPTGNPRKISLKGHNEFTIKFSYLEIIAQKLGYWTKRGPFADYIEIPLDDHLMAALVSQGRFSDNEEIIYQFIGDLYEYEYLLLIKR